MHWHLNHVWDKTIFHIIPLLLLLLYIQLLLLILLKVIEIFWLKVDCVLISVIQMYQDDTKWPRFQNNHINSDLLSLSSCISQSQYWYLLQNDSHGIIRMHWHLNHDMRQNNLSHHSSPSSLYSASSTQIVQSDREVLWLKVDCVLISMIQMYQDDTRWPPFQNKHLNTVLLSQTSYLTRSQYWC